MTTTATRRHRWADCRPALVDLKGATPQERERTAETINLVWLQLSNHDRQNFHRYCCLGVDDPATRATVTKITRMFQGHRKGWSIEHSQ